MTNEIAIEVRLALVSINLLPGIAFNILQSVASFRAGLPLQRLRSFALGSEGLIGRITAPALIELAGGLRQVRGWQLPSSAVDACLFAAVFLPWEQVAPGSSLPLSFGEIAIGRMPLPGEACEVHVRLREQGALPQGQAHLILRSMELMVTCWST